MRVSGAAGARARKIRSKKSSRIRRSSKSRRNRKKTKQRSLSKSRSSFLKKSKSRKIKKIKKTKKKMKGGSMAEETGGAAGGAEVAGALGSIYLAELRNVIEEVIDPNTRHAGIEGADVGEYMHILEGMNIFTVEGLVKSINTKPHDFYEVFVGKAQPGIDAGFVKSEFEAAIKEYEEKLQASRVKQITRLKSLSTTTKTSKALLSEAKKKSVTPVGDTEPLIELILATEGLDKASLEELELT